MYWSGLRRLIGLRGWNLVLKVTSKAPVWVNPKFWVLSKIWSDVASLLPDWDLPPFEAVSSYAFGSISFWLLDVPLIVYFSLKADIVICSFSLGLESPAFEPPPNLYAPNFYVLLILQWEVFITLSSLFFWALLSWDGSETSLVVQCVV